MNFDERGRLWVVQYRQYPYPEGLKVLSRDKHWRVQYDKVPKAPPNHERGRDRITIHEDTNGDGQFDKHKTFVDGLNLATAVEIGRGGVWVLNPPYLLFYPDKNKRRRSRRRPGGAAFRFRAFGFAFGRQQSDVGTRWLAVRGAGEHRARTGRHQWRRWQADQ